MSVSSTAMSESGSGSMRGPTGGRRDKTASISFRFAAGTWMRLWAADSSSSTSSNTGSSSFVGSGDSGPVDAGSELPFPNGDGGQSAAGSLSFRRLDGGGGDSVGEATRALFSRGLPGVRDVLESADIVGGPGVVSLSESGELDLEGGFGRFSLPDFSLVAGDDCEGAAVGRRGLYESRRLRNVSSCL